MTASKSYLMNKAVLILLIFISQIQSSIQKHKPHSNFRSIVDLEDIERFGKLLDLKLSSIIKSKTVLLNSSVDKTIEMYLNDFDETNVGNDSNINYNQEESLQVSNNLLCSYRLIRKVQFILPNLLDEKATDVREIIWPQIIRFFWKKGWTFLSYLNLAFEKILAVQQIYDFDAEKIANGLISDVTTNCPLNSAHRYEIGMKALNDEQYVSAITWLELAKQKCLENKLFSLVFIEMNLRKAIESHNDFQQEAQKNFEETYFNRKIRHYIPKDYKRAQKLRNILYKTYKGQKGKSYEKINYYGLCSGENFRSEKAKSQLFCWFEFKTHASLTIGPAKMELLSRNPDIVQIYEFLTFAQTNNLKENAFQALTKSTNSESMQINKSVTNPLSQTVSQVILSNKTNENLFRNKIQRFISLDYQTFNSLEPLFVEAHPSGGHFFPRLDKTLLASKNLKGHSTVTLFVYLNDVERGGDTAFTSVGVSSKPTRGSAVFWHDHMQDGTVDGDTVHEACPVLIGQKSVAKTSIRLGQLVQQKCSLNNNDRFRIQINKQYLKGEPPELANAASKAPKFESFVPQTDGMKLHKYTSASPFGLKAMTQFEWEIYPKIKYLYSKYQNRTKGTFREEFEKQNKDVRMYIQDFEDSTNEFVEQLENLPAQNIEAISKVALNPVVALKMIGRFLDYIQPWTQKQPSANNILRTKITSYLSKVYNISDGPVETHYRKAAHAILRLQIVYEDAVKDIANGYLAGIPTKIKLSAKDCYKIGRVAGKFKLFLSQIEWLTYALKLSGNNSDHIENYEELYDELASAEFLHDEALKWKDVQYFHLYQKPISQVPEAAKRIKQRSLQINSTHPDFFDINLFKICSGKLEQTTHEKSKLFCWYEREIHPVYKIGPIKGEFHSVRPNPEVVQFYDVLTNQTVLNTLKNYIPPNAHRLNLANPANPNELFMSGIARAFDYHMDSYEASYAVKLLQRISGFKSVWKETYPIHYFAYPPGTARGRHMDDISYKGERLFSTFLFYLSDVEKGGETAFPRFGLKVAPIKGSAVFWHNYFSCGTLEETTEHASCPVVFGEKYLFAKDIVEDEQEHYSCNMKPKTPYEILVNGKSKYISP